MSKRLALIIGNEEFDDPDLSRLASPLKDTFDFSRVLRKENIGGFDEVVVVANETVHQLNLIIADFYANKEKDDLLVLYYSGHGIQYHGNNYLIPLKTQIANPADLEQESVDVRRILVRMEQAEIPLSIVILDSCRNNPYKNLYGFRSYGGESGLAQISGLSTRSTLIAYATQPDNVAEDGVGRNGTYTKHLLRYLQQPGLSLPELFSEVGRSVSQETKGKQQPWVSFSGLPRFCFIGCDMVR